MTDQPITVAVLGFSRPVGTFWEFKVPPSNRGMALNASLFIAPPPKVPVSTRVLREGIEATDFEVTLTRSWDGSILAVYGPDTPNPQWFKREDIYLEVLAQGYEYSEPRLGMSRWPTISETANSLLFNLTEGSENQVSTVDAEVEVLTAVEYKPASRNVAIIEHMDDGQWRVAGYGLANLSGLTTLPLKVTTSGTLYAVGFDDYGLKFTPTLALAAGQRVRPTTYRGWVYEVVTAGVLPSVEPEWWPAIGENLPRAVGTLTLKAVRYFKPEAHGPITVTMV